jgi:hypothetical protein
MLSLQPQYFASTVTAITGNQNYLYKHMIAAVTEPQYHSPLL